jgi:prepilin-type N-terminal cleavage/methylation domain-containing protein
MIRTTADHPVRRGFTLAEVLVAAVIVAFVLGSVSMSLANIGRSKSTSASRLLAHLRADAAMNVVRRDIASIVRTDDLFFTRFLLYDDNLNTSTPAGRVERDELLLYSNYLRPVADIEYQGEGSEYETQYRVEADAFGDVLWVRRDPVPDRYEFGGGFAAPIVEGILSFQVEAYDGFEWFSEWDSDIQGLPRAVRIQITASGHRSLDDLETAPVAAMRTVIPIDRTLPLAEILRAIQEAEDLARAEQAREEGLDAAGGVPGAAGGDAVDGGRPGAGGGRPGAPGAPGGAGPGGGPGGGIPGGPINPGGDPNTPNPPKTTRPDSPSNIGTRGGN